MTRDGRLRIVLLIRSLNRGGAERQLALLAAGLDPDAFEVRVVTFYPGGPIWDELAAGGRVELTSLDKKGRWDNVSILRRLTALLADWSPDVLHCYMAEPSIVGVLAGRKAGVRAIVWGVRSSNVDYRTYGWVNWATFRASAWLARRPDLIIANSEAGRAFHVGQGYPGDRLVVIPNGIDAARFQPSPEARRAGRARLGLAETDLALGVLARLDPMKGHAILLAAAPAVVQAVPEVKIVCVGGGTPSLVHQLADETRRRGLDGCVLWKGEIDRPEAVLPAFDIAASVSVFGEGFSNAVAEAMACAVPCVVTDVGDSAAIVGDTGRIVRPSNAESLAEGLVAMARLAPADRQALGTRARARIVTTYSLHAMIQSTATAYRELSSRRRSG